MKRKNLIRDEEANGMTRFTEWYLLQDTDALKEAQFRELKFMEKKWVKEGTCEECGGFDILSKHEGMFLCNECLKLINSNNKKHKRKRK
ncbi:MAG: hypothetical protein IB618_00490 [Candidatus Pacearchaeota archaeon]|nr:MAG: hypothetical protein IB618_00490 [Candidatus Pacearchaeota archaeon]